MTEKNYFPMFVDMSNYHILIIGGGKIALRRIRTLLQFSPSISVIAPVVCEEIQKMQQQGKISVYKKMYEPDDLSPKDEKVVHMVIAATNDRNINSSIWKECKKRNILINVADDQALCDFYFPSIVMNDDVVIGINSGGKNPSVVKKIRGKIEELLGKTRKIYD